MAASEREPEAARQYSVKVWCSNCGTEAQMSFPVGKEVPRRMTCPNCGCWTMMKVAK